MTDAPLISQKRLEELSQEEKAKIVKFLQDAIQLADTLSQNLGAFLVSLADAKVQAEDFGKMLRLHQPPQIPVTNNVQSLEDLLPFCPLCFDYLSTTPRYTAKHYGDDANSLTPPITPKRMYAAMKQTPALEPRPLLPQREEVKHSGREDREPVSLSAVFDCMGDSSHTISFVFHPNGVGLYSGQDGIHEPTEWVPFIWV